MAPLRCQSSNAIEGKRTRRGLREGCDATRMARFRKSGSIVKAETALCRAIACEWMRRCRLTRLGPEPH